jgi:enamine deaminase RidA (YjgF/YER057c/UK114 family)
VSSVADRLAALGLVLPPVAKPLAAYVPAVKVGSLVWTSGQLAMSDGAILHPGKVGVGDGLVRPADAALAARRAALGGLAAINSVVRLDLVVRVVKVVGFVASAPGFTGQPQVVNGASELLGEVFGAAGAHARSAVGVAALPLDASVEIELVVEVV